MRVTQSMLSNNLLRDLNMSLYRQSKLQSQMTSNRRIGRLSDDPAGVTKSITARNELAKLEQYTRNVEQAKDWLAQTESSLYEMNLLAQRGYELSLAAANDTNSYSERQAMASEINQISEQFLTALNASFGGQFIFGGYNTTRAPFQRVSESVEYNEYDLRYAFEATLDEQKEQVINYEVGKGIYFGVSVSGLEITGTGSENVFHMFDEMLMQLGDSETDAQFSDFAEKFKFLQNHVMTVLSDIGGRQSRLEMLASRYSKDTLNNESVKARIEDADVSEVIMRFKTEESVYQGALSIGARVIQPSLLDFLK